MADLAALAERSGIRRVHLLAWRDLADVEAGGSEVHMARVAAVWARAGLDVTIRTSFAQGNPRDEVRDGYRVVRRSGRYGVFPAAIAGEVLRRNGPCDAMVEAWNGVPFLTPVWWHGPRVVLLHHVHRDMWPMVLTERLAKVGQTLEGRIAPPLYRRSAIVALSQSARREIIELLGLPADNITVAHPGIDAQFSPKGERSRHPLVVAVGRLMPPKRFDELIRICAEVRQHVPDLELVIAGEGVERTRLETQIRDLGAQDWITLPGRVPEATLIDLYRRAWMVASTSMAEGWGMTLTEAAACGTPTIATRIAGHADSVADGLSGVLVDSSRAFVSELEDVLRNPDRLDRLSEGALEHAATLTWEATAAGVFAPLAAQATARRRRR